MNIGIERGIICTLTPGWNLDRGMIGGRSICGDRGMSIGTNTQGGQENE